MCLDFQLRHPLGCASARLPRSYNLVLLFIVRRVEHPQGDSIEVPSMVHKLTVTARFSIIILEYI